VLALILPADGKSPTEVALYFGVEVGVSTSQESLHHLRSADLPAHARQDGCSNLGRDGLGVDQDAVAVKDH
jgi:hypothetical protein